MINALIARFPFGKLRQIADLPMVSYIEKPSGEGSEGMLDISTGSIKANTFWDASPSITGAGMDLGIVDKGINGDISRLQADGRHFFYSPDSTDYTENGYQSSSTGDHGTSVTAIVAATGDTLGVAYGLDDVISARRIEPFGSPIVYGAYDWIVAVVSAWPDSAETAEVINCSAGSQAVSGESYPDEAKFIDSVVDHWGVPVVVSAGNDTSGNEKKLLDFPNSLYPFGRGELIREFRMKAFKPQCLTRWSPPLSPAYVPSHTPDRLDMPGCRPECRGIFRNRGSVYLRSLWPSSAFTLFSVEYLLPDGVPDIREIKTCLRGTLL